MIIFTKILIAKNSQFSQYCSTSIAVLTLLFIFTLQRYELYLIPPILIPKSSVRAIFPALAGGFQAFVQLALQ